MQEATYHPSHFLSNLSQYTKELISCHDVMLIGQTAWNASLAPGPYEDWRGSINRIILSELSSRSVLELKGLHQWTNSYSELLSSNWLHPHFDSVIINDCDWWQIIQHKSFTSLSGIFPHGNSGNGELSVQEGCAHSTSALIMLISLCWAVLMRDSALFIFTPERGCLWCCSWTGVSGYSWHLFLQVSLVCVSIGATCFYQQLF